MSFASVTSGHRISVIPRDLVARYDVPGPRYTSYPAADRWDASVGPGEHARALEEAGRRAPCEPLSLYVHIPFCRSLCLYCGCNVVVSRRLEAADPYLDGVARETALVAGRLGARRRLAQLHWGGGTPTFLDEPRLERLWRILLDHFQIAEGAEVAIEIDPRVTTHSQLALLRSLGFNRVSLGVQDLTPDVQAAIGRHQTPEVTAAAMDSARTLGFDAVNIDLVYGLPGQTAWRWRRTLEAVARLQPDRVAVYSYAHVPALRPQQRRLPLADMAHGSEKLALLLEAHAFFGEAGYRPIGMDHFALPDDSLTRAQEQGSLTRNFQGYTVGHADDVVALGVTGISDLGGQLYAQSSRDLRAYLKAVAGGELATARGLRLDEDDRRRRVVIADLMCNFQVHLDRGDQSYFAHELEALAPLREDGLVTYRDGLLEVTPLGRFFVRNVAMVFDTRTTTTAAAADGSPARVASRTV